MANFSYPSIPLWGIRPQSYRENNLHNQIPLLASLTLLLLQISSFSLYLYKKLPRDCSIKPTCTSLTTLGYVYATMSLITITTIRFPHHFSQRIHLGKNLHRKRQVSPLTVTTNHPTRSNTESLFPPQRVSGYDGHCNQSRQDRPEQSIPAPEGTAVRNISLSE